MRGDPGPMLSPPRAIGTLDLSVKARGAKTEIDQLRTSGALKTLFPRQDQDVEALLINTSGGLTSGDRFDITAKAAQGTTLTLTTQAAERGYKAEAGPATVRSTLQVEDGAFVKCLPQELILYDGAHLDRSLTVSLAPEARFLMVEALVFGRHAMGEKVHALTLNDQITLTRNGTSLYHDALAFEGDMATHLTQRAVAQGAEAMASVVYVAPDAEAHLAAARERLTPLGGASCLRQDVLVMRLLAEDGYALRQRLVPVLDRLTGDTLPKSWRL